MRQQPADVVFGFGVVLPAGNAALHCGVEALDADFKLQHARRKLRHQRLEFLQAGQVQGFVVGVVARFDRVVPAPARVAGVAGQQHALGFFGAARGLQSALLSP